MFVDAYEKASGRKVRIPEFWFEHPVLGRGFSKTPSQKARDSRAAGAVVTAPDGAKDGGADGR